MRIRHNTANGFALHIGDSFRQGATRVVRPKQAMIAFPTQDADSNNRALVSEWNAIGRDMKPAIRSHQATL